MKRLAVLLMLVAGAASATVFGGGSAFKDHAFNGLATGVMTPPSAGDPCPFPATPYHHFAARLETAYANLDPVGTMTNFGSSGLDATQATGSAQPTFLNPCEAGVVDLPCFDGDAGDYAATATHTAFSGSATWCWVGEWDVSGAANQYIHDGAASGRNQGYKRTSNVFRISAPTNLNGPSATPSSYFSVCGEFNGVSSAIWTAGVQTHTGDTGTGKATGATLMGRYDGAMAMDGALLELLVFDGPVDESAVHDAFSCIYGDGWPKS